MRNKRHTPSHINQCVEVIWTAGVPWWHFRSKVIKCYNINNGRHDVWSNIEGDDQSRDEEKLRYADDDEVIELSRCLG